jgi:bifunctional non-homologous end joining protein LigD
MYYVSRNSTRIIQPLTNMGLETYHQKRDFRQTPEPKGKVAKTKRRRFVVQEHHASMLHFDFRLEMDGVLKSWSVRRGPSLDPADKRLAVMTEDHPVEYLKFEGRIPEGNYGAGEHMIWDAGTYELTKEGDALEQLEKGRISFRLDGEKLRGEFHLVRMGRRDGQWLLMKSNDEHAVAGWQLELRLDTDEAGAQWKREQSSGASKGAKKHAAGGTRSAGATVKEVKKYRTGKKPSDARTVAAETIFASKKLSGDVNVKIGRDIVALTNLDKVYWPDDGSTKGDLIRYYYEVAPYILPYLADRPLIMKRYPNGIKQHSFHQPDVNEAPDYVRTAALEVEDGGGHTVDYIVGDNLPTLLYMANLGAIERHPWHSRLSNLDRPDWFVFDLDPGEGIPFETTCELALVVRRMLSALGLEAYPKTSGSRGIHVYVPVEPVYSYEQIADFAARVAAFISSENSEIATVERALKSRRRGQIYLDHMQNARGKSVVAPYSVRPREGASVSAPLAWKEVEGKKLTPQDFTIKNILRRLERRGDLFKPVLDSRQTLDDALAKLKDFTRQTTKRRAAK